MIGPFYHIMWTGAFLILGQKIDVIQWRQLIPFSGRSQLRWIGVAFVGHIRYPSTTTPTPISVD